MSDVSVTKQRPDADIRADIHHMEISYPPLVNDRHQVNFEVEKGAVTVTGYVKGPPTYAYVIKQLNAIPGIKSLDHAQFYCDSDLRLDVGKAVPAGVIVMLEYGTVVLSGHAPTETSVESIVRQVGLIDGVRRVITNFSA